MTSEAGIGANVQAIIAETTRLISAAAGEVALFLGVMVGASCIVDFNMWNQGGDFLVNVLSLALGYVLVRALLRKGGLAPSGLRNGFGSYFGLSLLSGLAIIVGLLLLMVPGVLLLVRWLPAYGYSLAEGEGVTDALGKSWTTTGPHAWPILVSLTIPAGIMIAGLVIYVFGFSADDPVAPVPIILGNFLLMGGSLIYSATGIAVYSLVRGVNADLGEVFA